MKGDSPALSGAKVFEATPPLATRRARSASIRISSSAQAIRAVKTRAEREAIALSPEERAGIPDWLERRGVTAAALDTQDINRRFRI